MPEVTLREQRDVGFAEGVGAEVEVTIFRLG